MALVGFVLLALTGTASADHRRLIFQKEDVLGQGGAGNYQANGALLVRLGHRVAIAWRVPTPEPGSYIYPTPDQIPPWAPPHPPVTPGRPEVFTLWAFVFNYPELCSDPCNGDDIGDTPAQGGVYQVDATIARGKRVRMHGQVAAGSDPVVGIPLLEPRTAEIHVAMAPHGMALSGADLEAQLSIPL
ncbi:MAG: hypothetical protein OEV40_29715, partial [Acidimicrobiia bacterium]|nr:hypothetical protein [Acidimicrobiia bacterium]